MARWPADDSIGADLSHQHAREAVGIFRQEEASNSHRRGFNALFAQATTKAVVWLLRSLLPVTALVSTSLAGTFVVYGPQAFVRNTGKPTPVTANFSVLDPTTSYTLRIDNTGVSSAVVTINGVDVATPSDFNANVTVVTKPVTLLVNNQLSVELRGKTGESFIIQIIGVDNVLPTITAAALPPPNAAGWNNSNVTVTFTCSDKTSGIASCTAPITVASEGASRVIAGTAVDKAGNTATTSVTINLDKTLPSITATPTPAPNAAGWNNSNVTVTFACADALSAIDLCPAPAKVATEGAGQAVAATARDKAGNTAMASATIKLDKAPPTLTISSPASGSVVTNPSVTLTGTVADTLSGVASVACKGSPAQISGGNLTCPLTLTAGANSIPVVATDIAGNAATTNLTLTLSAAPTITITSPANLTFLNTSPVTVNGTISDVAATVNVNGIPTPQSSGRFSVPVPLIEGNNTITVVAQNAAGQAGTASLQVTLDTTPPHVTITSPGTSFVTTDSSITVSGIVNDIVVGTVNDQQAQVTVNGMPAQVLNRSFTVANVPLAGGSNIIQATGRDRSGNAATTSVNVTRQSPTGQTNLNVFSGNNQSGPIGGALPSPLTVLVRNGLGQPVVNRPVIFKVTSGDGTVSGLSSVAVNTNAQGQAQVSMTLGKHAGAANTVEASTAGVAATAIFSETGTPTDASLIIVDAGNNQTGAVGQPLPLPFVAVVADAGFNRLGNIPVTFTVRQGTGTLGGQPTKTVTSDSDGRVLVFLTLGPQEGNGNNLVDATFPGNAGLPAAFTASARIPGPASRTSISGVVLDNSNVPIQGVTMRLFQVNQGGNVVPQQIATPVQTNAQGQFTIQPAPVGVFKLMADGMTAQRPGNYPTLEYDMVTVSGQNNTVGLPIYLPLLDSVSKVCVSPSQGGTLTLPQSPGFSLTIAPGAATFPGGSRSGCVSVTPVHMDKVPMVPGFGQQPRFVVTIQPVGTTFNPPAAITIPNVDGLAPRRVTEMYSYDHDLASFVAIGTARVSDDGSVIRADPGVGVLKAGWHCGGDPAANGTVANCQPCRICQNNNCDNIDPAQDKQQCTTPIVSSGICVNGNCTPSTCSEDNGIVSAFPLIARFGVSNSIYEPAAISSKTVSVAASPLTGTIIISPAQSCSGTPTFAITKQVTFTYQVSIPCPKVRFTFSGGSGLVKDHSVLWMAPSKPDTVSVKLEAQDASGNFVQLDTKTVKIVIPTTETSFLACSAPCGGQCAYPVGDPPVASVFKVSCPFGKADFYLATVKYHAPDGSACAVDFSGLTVNESPVGEIMNNDCFPFTPKLGGPASPLDSTNTYTVPDELKISLATDPLFPRSAQSKQKRNGKSAQKGLLTSHT